MGYTKEEAEKRLQAALRGSRITGHKQMADIPKKRGVNPASDIGKVDGAANATPREKKPGK